MLGSSSTNRRRLRVGILPHRKREIAAEEYIPYPDNIQGSVRLRTKLSLF
jgi:hypothetical protein